MVTEGLPRFLTADYASQSIGMPAPMMPLPLHQWASSYKCLCPVMQTGNRFLKFVTIVGCLGRTPVRFQNGTR